MGAAVQADQTSKHSHRSWGYADAAMGDGAFAGPGRSRSRFLAARLAVVVRWEVVDRSTRGATIHVYTVWPARKHGQKRQGREQRAALARAARGVGLCWWRGGSGADRHSGERLARRGRGGTTS